MFSVFTLKISNIETLLQKTIQVESFGGMIKFILLR